MACRSIEEPLVFGAYQFPVLVLEGFPLNAQKSDLAVLLAKKFQQAVDSGQNRVNGGWDIELLA